MVMLGSVLVVSAIMTVFPFIWSALLSTRDRTEIFGTGISFAIGDSLAVNYAKATGNHAVSGRRCLTPSTLRS